MCGERLTTDLFVSTADVLDMMRYCRERKAVFDNSRNRRRNFDDVGTEEEIRRPNSSRRFTPSPTRGRSPIRRYRSPSPYRRSSQSPGRRSEEN
ncbi:CCHC-type domain-containing protein [Trichonephila clavipes]|nr:CCHC-type domain-containing protein [Trichonephila clavipes]